MHAKRSQVPRLSNNCVKIITSYKYGILNQLGPFPVGFPCRSDLSSLKYSGDKRKILGVDSLSLLGSLTAFSLGKAAEPDTNDLFLRHLRKLRRLELLEAPWFTDHTAHQIGSSLRQLSHLEVHDARSAGLSTCLQSLHPPSLCFLRVWVEICDYLLVMFQATTRQTCKELCCRNS